MPVVPAQPDPGHHVPSSRFPHRTPGIKLTSCWQNQLPPMPPGTSFKNQQVQSLPPYSTSHHFLMVHFPLQLPALPRPPEAGLPSRPAFGPHSSSREAQRFCPNLGLSKSTSLCKLQAGFTSSTEPARPTPFLPTPHAPLSPAGLILSLSSSPTNRWTPNELSDNLGGPVYNGGPHVVLAHRGTPNNYPIIQGAQFTMKTKVETEESVATHPGDPYSLHRQELGLGPLRARYALGCLYPTGSAS